MEIFQFKITTNSVNRHKAEFLKKFSSLKAFDNYLNSLENIKSITYSYKKENEKMYSISTTKILSDKKADRLRYKTSGSSNSEANKRQRQSRQSNIAIINGKSVSLSVQPRYKVMERMLEESPLTSLERNFVKGLMLRKTMTKAQYLLFEEAKLKVNRRKHLKDL